MKKRIFMLLLGVSILGLSTTGCGISTSNKNDLSKNSQNVESSQEDTEVKKKDVDSILKDYYNNTILSEKGIASTDIEADFDAIDTGSIYTSTDGSDGILGYKLMDIDSDNENEMLVVSDLFENTGEKYLQLAIYDAQDEDVIEIPGIRMKSQDFGSTNATVQLAYQQKNDGFYVYFTRAFSMTMHEGGYGVGEAVVYRCADNIVTQQVEEPNYEDYTISLDRYMEMARNEMPTIVDAWYSCGGDNPNAFMNVINQKSLNSERATLPLFCLLSDTDPNYTVLAKVQMMQKRESATYDTSTTQNYGFIDIYEMNKA